MQYQQPPPIFGSLIFYQTICCSQSQIQWMVPQLTNILRGQRIANARNVETIRNAFQLALTNAILLWNKGDLQKQITLQLFVGEHRWGFDIQGASNQEEEIPDSDSDFQKNLNEIDDCMDEIYYYLDNGFRFMMVRSR